jgi:Tol biopolymer transport system component
MSGGRAPSPINRPVAAFLAAVMCAVAACQAAPPPPPSVEPSVPPSTAPTPTPSPIATPRPITGRIAYVRLVGVPGDVQVTDIWIVNADGDQTTQITSGPEYEFSPFWLLDGSRLAFAVFDYSKNPYYGRLVSVQPDGSGRRDLSSVANYGDGLLSPDGRYVAWGGGGAIDGSDGITLFDRSTGEGKLLTTDGATDPIWSPDGKALLVREYLLGAVAVVEIPSGRLTRFEKPDIDEVLGWTADGASIVFSGPQSENTTTWMALATGGPIVEFPGVDLLASPSWTSPDGQWIVDGSLVVSPAAGGQGTVIAPELRMLAGPPSWSPDGSALSFAGSTPDEVGDRKSAIYVVGVDSKTPVRVTAGPLDTSPAWDPSP